jgi:hypothetical protein
LVVLGGVQDEVAEQSASVSVDDANVVVLDQEQDVGSGVGSADADVVEASVVAQGDHAGGADAVLDHRRKDGQRRRQAADELTALNREMGLL